jgi:hypothetical protein
VLAVPSSECQREAGSIVDGSFKPLHALLFFCGVPGGHDAVVRLRQPVVEGVWLDVAPKDAKPGWDSALLYVGGNASVDVVAGRFEHNHAGYPLLLAGSARIKISSSSISGNHQGGLALQANASARIISSNVTSNTAEFGAGLYEMGSSRVMMMHGTRVANNTAENKDGGVYAKDTASIACESGSAIDSNRAWQDGAVMTLEDSANASLTNCSVSFNTASGTRGGGILASDNSTVKLNACELNGNEAGKEGGAVALQADSDKCKSNGLYSCRPSLHMHDSIARNNSASVQGVALYVGPGASAVVSGSILQNNKARNGGGVHVRGNEASAHAVELTVEGGTLLSGNAAEIAGGINVYGDDRAVSKCVARISDTVFAANTASQGGGGIVANARCSVVAPAAVMHDNSAGKVGGAFSVTGGVSWSMHGVQLLHNMAQMAGAGYVGDNASVLISSSSLVEGNVASHDGGAFALADTAQLQLFGGSRIVGNKAAVSGGGIAAVDVAGVVITGSVCHNNSAGANGGCVHLLDHAEVSFVNGSDCAANTACTSGGCVCAVGNSSVQVSHVATVHANRARVGGGVALLDIGPNNDAPLRPVVFNNTATDMGDNVYVDFVNVTLFVQSIASSTDGMLTQAQLQQAGQVVGYVSRSVGPGLAASLVVMSNGSSAGSGVRVEASVLSGVLQQQRCTAVLQHSNH